MVFNRIRKVAQGHPHKLSWLILAVHNRTPMIDSRYATFIFNGIADCIALAKDRPNGINFTANGPGLVASKRGLPWVTSFNSLGRTHEAFDKSHKFLALAFPVVLPQKGFSASAPH